MSDALFITASGTDAGKTLVACALAHQARAAGRSVRVLKPVATGFDAADAGASDTAQLLTAAGQPVNADTIAACTPWRFPDPISPDMAAARAGRTIDFDALAGHCRAATGPDHLTLIEGIGGTMVPLTRDRTVRDLIKALDLPAVVVTGSYLGALSHTLTAVESLLMHGIAVRAVVVSESAASPVPLVETCATLAGFIPAPVLAIPRLAPGPRLWEAVPPLTACLAG